MEQDEEELERWSRRTGEALNLARCNIPEKNNPASPCSCRQQRIIFAWTGAAVCFTGPDADARVFSVWLDGNRQEFEKFPLPELMFLKAAAPAGSCDHLFVLISLTL